MGVEHCDQVGDTYAFDELASRFAGERRYDIGGVIGERQFEIGI
jgi:hypothetical protein